MQKQNFVIDKITESIEDSANGLSYETDVLLVTSKDLKSVLKRAGWRFNWKIEFKYLNRQLYKLTIKGDKAIQGLLSLQIIENYVEMHLIEVAPHNYGKTKKYLGTAGNLVAFACKMSFELGFEGFVAFTAKTQLIRHYSDSLGATLIFRNRMCISGEAAKKLVNSYYKNSK
jgi:hypothetical protein